MSARARASDSNDRRPAVVVLLSLCCLCAEELAFCVALEACCSLLVLLCWSYN